MSEAILLLAYGAPPRAEDVPRYLENVAHGKHVPPERLAEAARHYAIIGGASPFNKITQTQAQALEALGRAEGYSRSVRVGFRYWRPFIFEALAAWADQDIRRVRAVVMAPHRCEVSWERYQQAVQQARQLLGERAPQVEFAPKWFDHPLFLQACAERLREAAPPSSARWVFVAHSIPAEMARHCHYVEEVQATAEGVAAHFNKKDWSLAYISRSGVPSDPWLGPDVHSVLRSEAARGASGVFVIPIGFVADNMEILYDLDIEGARQAEDLGMAWRRAATVGTHPSFIQMLHQLVS